MAINSINTNAGALIALQNLNATNRDLDVTQTRINTGKAVNSAKDNGAIWSIATKQSVERDSLNSVKQSLQRGQSTIDVAMNAGEQVKDMLSQMRQLVVSASDPSVDKASMDAYQDDFENLAKRINTTIQGASFNGVNMIANIDATTGQPVNKSATVGTEAATGKSLKALASADAKNTIDVAGVNFGLYATQTTAGAYAAPTAGTPRAAVASTASSGTAVGIKLAVDSFSVRRKDAETHAPVDEADRAAEWTGLLKQVDDSLTYVTSSLTKLGTGARSLDDQLVFTGKLQDSLENGIGNLVDADLAKESARLTALQTKQQLGIQALSIANQASSSLLGLFR